MINNGIFDRYCFIPDKAVSCGFQLVDGKYQIRKDLEEDGFYAVFRITENSIEIHVYEEPDGEPYLPFNTTADGGFVGRIRACVDAQTDQILRDCFVLTDVKAILIDYVQKKYGTVPEAPWDYLKEYHTLNTAGRHKWYGLFMLIPYKYLGVEKEGKIHVLNLKAKSEDIPALIDHIHYFPAYHMNKKYWISILLDRDADIAQLQRLLDNSYAIVEGNQKKSAKSIQKQQKA